MARSSTGPNRPRPADRSSRRSSAARSRSSSTAESTPDGCSSGDNPSRRSNRPSAPRPQRRPQRSPGHPWGSTPPQVGPARHPGMAAFYPGCNRAKGSVVLDLKQETGRKALFKLAETADVLMHNYRPEPARRLGVEYEKFEKINPRLVYLATYGYRSAGPLGPKAAHDDIIQAVPGLPPL